VNNVLPLIANNLRIFEQITGPRAITPEKEKSDTTTDKEEKIEHFVYESSKDPVSSLDETGIMRKSLEKPRTRYFFSCGAAISGKLTKNLKDTYIAHSQAIAVYDDPKHMPRKNLLDSFAQDSLLFDMENLHLGGNSFELSSPNISKNADKSRDNNKSDIIENVTICKLKENDRLLISQSGKSGFAILRIDEDDVNIILRSKKSPEESSTSKLYETCIMNDDLIILQLSDEINTIRNEQIIDIISNIIKGNSHNKMSPTKIAAIFSEKTAQLSTNSYMHEENLTVVAAWISTTI